jgi:predicted GNAT family acetyltransferase
VKFVTENNRLTVTNNGSWVGELSFPALSDQRVVLERTFVAPTYQGQGIGSQLVAKFVEYAKQHHLTVKLMCPFAKQEFSRHPAYQEVLPVSDRWWQ